MFIGYPGPIRLYDQIQSDSLATSVAAMFMAAVIFALRTRSISSFVAVYIALAVAVTIRPINLVLVVPVPGGGVAVGGWRMAAAPGAWRPCRGGHGPGGIGNSCFASGDSRKRCQFVATGAWVDTEGDVLPRRGVEPERNL